MFHQCLFNYFIFHYLIYNNYNMLYIWVISYFNLYLRLLNEPVNRVLIKNTDIWDRRSVFVILNDHILQISFKNSLIIQIYSWKYITCHYIQRYFIINYNNDYVKWVMICLYCHNITYNNYCYYNINDDKAN